MRQRVLSRRELNRALLARQLLLRRARLPVARAVERVGALQAQWPPAPYVALWARLEGFERAHLVRAVERRRVVKTALMRVTLHLVSADDYRAYAGLVREARLQALERAAEREGVEVDLERLAPRLVRLASEGRRTRPELLRLLGLPPLRAGDRRAWFAWHLLAARAELVHGPESSVWRNNAAGGTFLPASVWLGERGGSGDHAAEHLVRRYLAAFGPATRADVARWTGLPLAALEPGFARRPLRELRDADGRRLLDLPRAPLPSGDAAAPARFLPMWDSALLAHDDRTRILPEDYRREVIRPNGDVRQTFLVDGFVAGTWQLVDGRVIAEPFERLAASARREVEGEAQRLAGFLA